MRKILLLFLFTLLIVPAYSWQKTVIGKVTDFDTGEEIVGVNVVIKGTTSGTITDLDGNYSLKVPSDQSVLVYSYVGYQNSEVMVGAKTVIDVKLIADRALLEEVIVTGYGSKKKIFGKKHKRPKSKKSKRLYCPNPWGGGSGNTPVEETNTESYDEVMDNKFHSPLKNPLSTFSIDVDAASYSNARRFITQGQVPPKDAVRVEEFINYFTYDYEQPTGKHPFSIHKEVASCPWNDKRRLVHIGLQGKKIDKENLPPSNLVFLLDVSGSMSSSNKLPLVKSAMKLLVAELRPEDRVSIVVYAGAAGLVLKPTPGNQKDKILEAIQRLSAGGSTAGGQGIKLAYKVAMENFKKKGNNRIIIATDGDFNVGASSDKEMVELVEEKRKSGVFLTCLGFGMGNYKDSKMEKLADKGNGNYAYIDNMLEAQKVFVNEFGATMFAIAKDVKLQVEFNPAKVQAYRLIGYENRLLEDEDFDDDTKDAGELGAGHTVTALYEVIPVGVKDQFTKNIPELKYSKFTATAKAGASDELLTVKFRYKKPKENKSILMEETLVDENMKWDKSSENFRFSASVAAFGMLLRESEHIKKYSYEQVVEMAKNARGEDEEGYRAEFIRLVKALPKIK